ncbi:hypothetical protein EV363DRAFT_246996 [Boletus edulis]|nr:hypothetical protein EV363DRAFT_246996 [Boletus edulis]
MLIWLLASFSTSLKTWCARATRSRLTMAFFFVMLANVATQTTLHSIILSHFSRNRELVTSTIDAAGVQRGFAVVQNDVMEICSGVPLVRGTACYTVYNGSAISTPTSTNASVQCAEGLIWLENYLINSKSEEVICLTLGNWYFMISLIALMDESIPHLIVVLAAQFVTTGWISYRIARDIAARHTYTQMVVNGACGGFDILGGSWQYTNIFYTVGCSIAVLFGMSFFVFKLIKLYSMAKLSSVGSPPVMNRMLRWRLWMRVFLQFTGFFTLASVAAWYDKRKSLTTASNYSTSSLYDVGFYVVAIIMLPWLTLGTYSISKENRLLFLAYAILSIILLVISGLWFASPLYRYEYWSWRTFSCVVTMADVLLVITCILSVICRLSFGKGLAHFLVVEQKLQASGFAHDTFLNGPKGVPSRSMAVKQALASKRSEPLSKPTLDPPESSWQRPLSNCSVETAMFATWLPAIGSSRDEEEGKSPTVREEGPVSAVTIAWEDVRLSSAQSLSDYSDESNSLDEFDEKQTIVS